MLLGQIKPNGATLAAVFEGGEARTIPNHTVLDLIRHAEAERVDVAQLASQLASRPAQPHAPVLPIHPLEVWGCGCTYESSASFRDAEHGAPGGIYSYVYREARPEIFFKGTCRVCAGPGRDIGIRPDSRFTVVHPELAVVLGSRGRIVGYTLANDVSAWDIERENPLYLSQSKIYNGCCALGPYILTADELPDPYNLTMSCTIVRDGHELFTASVSTQCMHRRLDSLIEYLMRANNVPAGSVLLTGTGIVVPETAALAPGDLVTIRVPEIGELTNRAALME